MKQKGHKHFVDILETEGIKFLFGNPGTTELAIMEALGYQDKIQYVLGLQEAIVVAMADGYSRATGKLAAANVHVAPGLGNAMGSLYNAKFHGSPLILTAGQQEQGHGLMEPMLYDPLVPIAQPMVKWAIEVSRAQDLERIVRRAAKVALTPPTGPVFISLPGDILDDYVDDSLQEPTRINTAIRPSEDILKKLSTKIIAAKNPVIIVGHEIASTNALDEAGRFATLVGAPVWQQTVPHGAHFSTDHECFQGHLPRIQEKVKQILEPHDLLIVVGADVLRMSVMSKVDPLPRGIPILHISERDWEIGKNYPTEMAINANVKETLRALIPQIEHNQCAVSKNNAKKRVEKYKELNWKQNKLILASKLAHHRNTKFIHPERLMMLIGEHVSKDAIIVEEGLSSTSTLLSFLPISSPDRFFGLASGGIGFAAGGSIGISLAAGARPIVAIIGDGSIMYSIQALWTAAHLNLPITYLVLNNQGYEILKQRLQSFRGTQNFIGMSLNDPLIDFTSLAQSMGVPSVKANSEEHICQILKETSYRKGPLLVDVHLEPTTKN